MVFWSNSFWLADNGGDGVLPSELGFSFRNISASDVWN